MQEIVLIVAGAILLAVAIPVALLGLILLWPLLLCWYLGHPVIGVIAMLIWWSMAR